MCGGGAGGWDAGRESRVFLTGVGIHPLFLEQIKNVIQEGSAGVQALRNGSSQRLGQLVAGLLQLPLVGTFQRRDYSTGAWGSVGVLRACVLVCVKPSLVSPRECRRQLCRMLETLGLCLPA